ncbi:multimerin-2a [Pristis pectinata]|uniref:multimerin-2a n=1 Tax=Pristis pectinata TaxID=685728 RepID=UPI00223E2B46|nr:multimerin-2a [Pristis pectinata]
MPVTGVPGAGQTTPGALHTVQAPERTHWSRKTKPGFTRRFRGFHGLVDHTQTMWIFLHFTCLGLQKKLTSSRKILFLLVPSWGQGGVIFRSGQDALQLIEGSGLVLSVGEIGFGGGRVKGADFLSNEAGLSKQQEKPRHQIFEKVEEHVATQLDGWGYEEVQGTNQPYSYVRTTTSDSSRRQTSVTSARAPLKSPPDRNWCAFVKSRLSTAVISCGVERFVQRPTEPCINCQNTVYQLALKPMYKVKQMIVTSLEWRCCPGHMGSNCEHTVPQELRATSLKRAPKQEKAIEEAITPAEPVLSINGRRNQDPELLQQQDDVSVSTAVTQDFHRLLSSLRKIDHPKENNGNQTELPGLQDMVKSYVENFLNQHLHSFWTSLNNSLLVLSDKVFNLSQDIEIDRRNHNELLKRQRGLEEWGIKLRLKLDENSEQLQKIEDTLKGQQLRFDKELHAQRVNLDHNMTTIKTETDLKVKRSQKIIQIKSHLLDNTTAELRKDQDRLWLEIYALNQSIARTAELHGPNLCSSYNLKAGQQEMGMTKEVLDKLSATLQIHSSNLTNVMCGMCDPTSNQVATFQQKLEKQESNCAQMVAGLNREMNQKLNETQVGFMEAVLGLNVSFNHQSFGHNELISSLNNKVKELSQLLYGTLEDEQLCDCQKLLVDYSLVIDNLRNASDFMDKMHFDLNYVKQQELELSNNLNDSVQDLFMALQQIRQQIQDLQFLQEGKQNILTEDILKLKKNSTMIMKEISYLKKFDATMDSHIKYLNSSFNSLLEDALRHTLILQSLLEQDILEVTSEDATKLELLSMSTLYQILNETEKDLAAHKIILENINMKLQLLEEDRMSEEVRKVTEAEIEENFLKESSSEIDDTDNPELMEPEQEAMKEKLGDLQHKTSEISFIEKHIEMLNLKLIKLESHCNSKDNDYNHSLRQMKEEFTKSVETLQLDVSSLKLLLESHISDFQKFIGNTDRLSNGTLRTGRSGLGLMRMRKQHRENHHGNRHLGIYRNGSAVGSGKRTPAAQEFQAAFFVGLSNNSETSKILNFDQIFLNYGDGYLKGKGYFKAPFKGIYMFVVTGQGLGHGYLLVDGTHAFTLQSSTQNQQSSVVWGYAILELNKGQHVWVEVAQGFMFQQTHLETTFGGFLLFKTS